MTDNLAADVQAGREAQAALENGVIHRAFTDIEQNTVETWRDSLDPKVREDLWQILRALGLLKRYLQSAIGDGKLAQAAIEQQK